MMFHMNYICTTFMGWHCLDFKTIIFVLAVCKDIFERKSFCVTKKSGVKLRFPRQNPSDSVRKDIYI